MLGGGYGDPKHSDFGAGLTQAVISTTTYSETEAKLKLAATKCEDNTIPVLFEFLLAFVWCVLLLPIILLIATPCILIASFLGKGLYLETVKEKYRGVIKFWKKWGWGFTL
ncbi:MAG TPA: hypothetical protein VLB06_04530 [Sulfuricaulis sp.]|nr:hypothetical protein [Sulfuricaulis sp.]